MRHVSRTHRVALDWLFDRINLDPKIQIRHIDTKHQLADMLAEGNFTRDEWNNLLHLYNISHFSSTCCTKNFSLTSCSTVAKGIQDQTRSRKGCVQVATSSDEFIYFYTKGCIPWRVNGKAAGKPVASRRRRFRRTPTILRLRSGTTKGNKLRRNPLPETVKLGDNPLHTEPVLQLTRKVQRIQKRHGTTISKYRRTHPMKWKPSSPWSGKSVEDNLAILCKI